MKARFTLNGNPELERYLADICAKVKQGVEAAVPGNRLEAILLGGGYGRGEGGVLETGNGQRPYNDVEFYVCLRGYPRLNEWRYGKALEHVSEELTAEAGLEVELKVVSLDHIRRSQVSMFYYDLIMGHRWVLGDESLLRGCNHHADSLAIPPSEALRLLMNRCSGLLFCKQRLARSHWNDQDADFVGRNLAKAQLAFGDVVLTALGSYHWSCVRRHELLRNLDGDKRMPWLERLWHEHHEGVQFKLQPTRTRRSPAELAEALEELIALGRELWLWLENRRLGIQFPDIQAYAFSEVDKCPETAPWKNRLLNGRTFGARETIGDRARFYPRQRLLHALALLLWDDQLLDHPPALRRVQQELDTRSTSFEELVARYHRLWEKYN